MKTNPISDKSSFFTRLVQDKGHSSQFSREFDQEKEKQKKEEQNETVEVTDKNVTQAIEKLAQDENLAQLGIQMSMTGSGPGLKVILKDGSGVVIRQLSGEDFLKLKQMTDKESHKHSRLLNTKV